MSIADVRPKPYDLDNQNEVMRLLRECEGYLRTCKNSHHGTDFEGRKFAMEALASLWESLARGEVAITNNAHEENMEFVPFPKIARLSREIIVTEKIDGTNASICILETGEMLVGSRTRWITPQDDNYGFAKWVEANKPDLMNLGVGHHFGEWWGQGIQRNYSQTQKIFSLFNTSRWSDDALRPSCCRVVPVLYSGAMEDFGVMKGVKQALNTLQSNGSVAAPGFMKPEGIVIFHPQGNILFKKTLEKDDEPKSKSKAA